MNKKIEIKAKAILILVLFAMSLSSSIVIAGSGDENRTSSSERLGDDNGKSFIEPERSRAEDRTRMEDR